MSRLLLLLLAALTMLTAAGCGDKQRPRADPSAPTRTSFVRKVASVKTGVAPVAVTVGEGAVWVADNADGTVTRVDPRTHRQVGAPIRVGSGPVAIAAGGGGVWVALASGSVVRIDPRTRRRVGASIPVVDPGGIAVDGDRVWVTSRAHDELLRIDARSGRTTGPAIPVGAKPTDVAAGLGGVWVANSADGTVTHVNPDTGRADEPIHVARHRALNPGTGGRPVEQPGGAEVLGLTVGEGAVWVAKTDSVQTTTIQVRRIDPRTRRVTGDPIAVDGGIPMHLAAGGGGVWVTDVGSLRPGEPPRRPALQRIDPGTRRVSGDPIPLGRQPAGLAVGPTGVWVAEAGENTVAQIGAGGGRG